MRSLKIIILVQLLTACGEKNEAVVSEFSANSILNLSLLSSSGFTSPEDSYSGKISIKFEDGKASGLVDLEAGRSPSEKTCKGNLAFTEGDQVVLRSLLDELRLCAYQKIDGFDCTVYDAGFNGITLEDPTYKSKEDTHSRVADKIRNKNECHGPGTEFYLCGGQDELYSFLKSKIKFEDSPPCTIDFSTWF